LKKTQKNKINGEISVTHVNLVDLDGTILEQIPLSAALEKAANINLDLVEVNSNNNITVCKLMDYGKHLYETKKKTKNGTSLKKQTKEMKFRPCTDDGDINTKVNKIKSFLNIGHEIKIVVQFKGREQAHFEFGFNLIEKVFGNLENLYKIKQDALRSGRLITAIIQPK
jgi:translation initiation factor IF-3